MGGKQEKHERQKESVDKVNNKPRQYWYMAHRDGRVDCSAPLSLSTTLSSEAGGGA